MDATTALLLAEMQQLRSDVKSLLERTPDTRLTWIDPAEFASMVGKSPRTVLLWRDQGVFREESVRRNGNRFQYHRTNALADVENHRRQTR